MSDADSKKLFVAILLLATVIRLLIVFVFFRDYQPREDAAHWHVMAQNFLNGRGLMINEIRMIAYRTPVPGLYFAAIYSVFGVSVRAVQIANAFLGVLTVWLVYDLVRRSFGAVPALWAAILVSCHPLLLLYTGYLLSETPVIMLLALALWLVWGLRNRAAIWFPVVGIVLGLATLTRETALPIAALVAVWSFSVRRSEPWLRRCLPVLVILFSLALTIAPWAIRNYLLLGRFIPLTSRGGESLWEANNPLADGTAIGVKVLRIPQVDALPEVDRGIAYQKRAVRFILENPLLFAQLTLRRLPYFWHLGYHSQGLAEIAFLIFYLPLLALAIIGIWVAWRCNLDATLLLLIVPVSLTVVHMVFLPEGRYRLPAELIMCMFAGNGAYWISTRNFETANAK